MQKTAGLLFENVVVSKKKPVDVLQYKCSCCRRQLLLLFEQMLLLGTDAVLLEKDAMERYWVLLCLTQLP
jgi:hypothetical protein